jgi:glycosyltransferase involved in cell wall biosynthesis
MQRNLDLVSIIIPVHNKNKAMKCVDHIKQQTYPLIEIIPVDFEGFPAEKRNYGYKKSKGDLIFFLDEDEYLMPTAISSCVSKFHEGFDIIGVVQENLDQKKWLTKCISTWYGPKRTVRFTFFKREVLETVGLLDTKLIFCDETDLLERAEKAGFRRVLLSKEPVILHDPTLELKSAFLKAFFARHTTGIVVKYTLDKRAPRVMWQRKRIVKALQRNPSLIFGVFLVGFITFVARRIP